MERKGLKLVRLVILAVLFLLIPSLLIYAGGSKALQSKLDECNDKNATLESENSEINSENQNLKSQNEDLKSRISRLEAEKSELEKKTTELEAQVAAWQAELESYGLEPEEPSVVAKTVEETLLQKEAQIIELEADVEQINRELEQARSELENTRGKLERTNRELEQARSELDRANRNLDQANRKLQQTDRELSELNIQIVNARRETDQLQIENALNERKIDDLTQENEELLEALEVYDMIQEEAVLLMDIALKRINEVLREEIESGQVRIFKGTLGLILDVVSEHMFEMGSVELNPAGRAILGKIAGLLAELDGYFIGVIGNADSKPIVTPALKKRFPTNWELSARRGAVVVRYLLDNADISPRRMIAMGLGEYQPIDNNTTEGGRGNNRRVDIVLLPIDTLAAVIIGAEIK